MMLKNITYLKTTHLVSEMPNDDIGEIVISGRSNVGKSTLINKLGNNKKLAKISQRPGKTRALSLFNIDDKYRLVDIPGYGYANVSKSQIALFQKMIENYFENRKNVKMVLLLLDIRRGITKDDQVMIQYIKHFNIPVIIIGTKMDKANQSEIYNFEKEIKKELNETLIIKYSAITNFGIEKIRGLF